MKDADAQLHRIDGCPEHDSHSLTDQLQRQGIAVNARCGQRGLCRGCMVDLVEGRLQEIGGDAIEAPCAVRSCRMRVPDGKSVSVRLQPQAQIGEAGGLIDTFRVDTPCQLDPLYPATSQADTGFAIDLGTTTVVVLVADLGSGEVLARAGAFNAQIRFGDNVISRIAAGQSSEKREAMRRALIEETLNPLLETACRRAGRDPARLAGGTIAGNTTMLHILADVDPTPLGLAPFTAPFLAGRELDSAALGLAPFCPLPLPVQLLPGLAAYLGADISAGILATGMTLDTLPSLLVDMGTNGELVLHHRGRLVGCATAAGPAFEGAGLSYGTRARQGAVCGLQLGTSPFVLQLEHIGKRSSGTGICGSAYIDFLAQARRIGLLNPAGRFDPDAWQQVPAAHRIEDSEDGRSLRLQPDHGPAISEIDVAELIQAKAAIGAGIEILLGHCGLSARDIGRVHLAGGFGMHVDVGHAIAIGLLPEFAADQVQVVGNTSLAGALLALLDRHALEELEGLRLHLEAIELNEQPDFEITYIDHLVLP